VNRLSRGDELPTGVLEMVKIYVATKRSSPWATRWRADTATRVSISKILPEEDMPFLADGTPVDLMLNPLGVPSRMNVGQILETHARLGREEARLPGVTRRCSTAAPRPRSRTCSRRPACHARDGKAALRRPHR
jgi:DNA-directed RNA polymerase subunit beta